MMPTNSDFLCVGRKCWQRTAYFVIIGNVPDLVSGFCDQIKKILFFQLVFWKSELQNNFFSVSVSINFLAFFNGFFLLFNFFQLGISPHSVQMWENAGHANSEYGHFLHSVAEKINENSNLMGKYDFFENTFLLVLSSYAPTGL